MSQKIHEIQLSSSISEHDMSYRLKWAENWIKKNDKVKIVLSLKGRQKLHPEIGYNKISAFVSKLYNVAVEESALKQKGNVWVCIMRPK